jgi:hypothetical protein
MPKMTLTEEEACLIREDRKVKALQAVAWNEAIDQCWKVVHLHEDISLHDQEQIKDKFILLKRKP